MSERRKLKQSLFEQIALLVFKALRGMAQMYLQDLFQVKTPGRFSLRSDALGLLKVPPTVTFGDPAFAAAVPDSGTAVLLLSQRVTLLIILKGT